MATNIDLDKYRLRRFVRRLIDLGEVEIHDEPVPLTRLSEIIEGTDKALLFRQAGPERLEMTAKTACIRLAIALIGAQLVSPRTRRWVVRTEEYSASARG